MLARTKMTAYENDFFRDENDAARVPAASADARSAWLLGVCGMGVGPLAIYMRGEGWDVSGWDDAADSPMRAFLVRAGVRFVERLPAGTAVVGRSSAVKPGNPHYEEAVKNGCRLLRRGELLAERAASKKLIAVCGSHGKTTTSGMLAQTLAAAGTDAGYVLGGLYRDAEMPPARCSTASDWLVAEVDESDGTIRHFSPEITVAVNLDWDHPDYYKTEADLERTFRELFERTRRAVFVPAGNARLERLARGLRVPVFTVGDGGDYAFRVVRAGAAETRVELGGAFPHGPLVLPVAGTFNTQNAMLALAATAFVCGGKIGVAPLGKFPGMRRRQDRLYAGERLSVFADYAHHPTEIAALLRLLRETHLGRLVVVFQPHRHSRTRQYAAAFAEALSLADEAMILPVYAAGEAKISGGESEDILAAVAAGTRPLRVCADAEEALARLREIAEEIFSGAGEETVVAFVGAGDIDRIAAAPFARELWLREAGRPRGNAEDFGTRMARLLPPKTVFRADENLGARTTLGVGGNAAWYAEPEDANALLVLLRGARVYGLPTFALGRGSNLLVSDAGFSGLVVRLAGEGWARVRRERDSADGAATLDVGAGAKLKELCAFAAREGLSGFEFLDGIPGTLGGALRMNAGAHGASVFDRVVSVEWLTPEGVRREAPRESLNPRYRDCPELHGAIVLGARLRAAGTRPSEAIFAEMRRLAEIRRASQPRERSAGCTFKNPPGESAGRLIDSLGLKGSRVGGAVVSAAHANFITTDAGATAADVEALVRRVRGVVEAETGVRLDPEIILLGGSWE